MKAVGMARGEWGGEDPPKKFMRVPKRNQVGDGGERRVTGSPGEGDPPPPSAALPGTLDL